MDSAVEKTLSSALSKASSTKENYIIFIHAHIFISEALKDWFYFSYMETRYFTGIEL
jgi:hypothetical protein